MVKTPWHYLKSEHLENKIPFFYSCETFFLIEPLTKANRSSPLPGAGLATLKLKTLEIKNELPTSLAELFQKDSECTDAENEFCLQQWQSLLAVMINETAALFFMDPRGCLDSTTLHSLGQPPGEVYRHNTALKHPTPHHPAHSVTYQYIF